MPNTSLRSSAFDLKLFLFSLAAFALLAPGTAHGQQALPGLANRWVLVVRHGEKPETGTGLTPAGEARARAYVSYFTHYTADGKQITIGRLIATKDGKNSWRERLTLTPLSEATKIPLEMGFKNGQYDELVQSLNLSRKPGNILICWHHGNIPAMITAFGADPDKLIGSEKWPSDHFDWVIQLHYDGSGRLIPKDVKRVVEPKF
jgi:hypothetical protein